MQDLSLVLWILGILVVAGLGANAFAINAYIRLSDRISKIEGRLEAFELTHKKH